MSYKIEAIILKSRDIKQYDRIYTVFSKEQGKTDILGVGVRKTAAKLAGGLEPMTKSEIFLVGGRWMDRATGVIILNQYVNIKINDNILLETKKLLNIIDLVANEKERREEIYGFLEYFLDVANKRDVLPEKVRLLKLGLIWKAIAWSGFSPDLHKCRICGQTIQGGTKIIFSIPGGIICQSCGKKRKENRLSGNFFIMSENSVKILRIFLRNKYSVAGKIAAKKEVRLELERLTSNFLENLFEKKIIL